MLPPLGHSYSKEPLYFFTGNNKFPPSITKKAQPSQESYASTALPNSTINKSG